MTREIKFRAWDKEEEEMVSWETLIGYCDLDYLFGNINETPKRVTIPDFEVMQYTGLKDANGVEIYEGDIVIHKHPHVDTSYIGHVTIEPYAGIFIIYPKEKTVRFGLDDIQFEKYIEVIGNIYENPELLQEDE